MTTQTFQLESLAYQTDAVRAVVEVFSGTPKSQPQDGSGNHCPLPWEQVQTNIQQIALRQRIGEKWLQLSAPGQGQPIDLCVEMETGTGKTLVYLRTLYRLHTAYGWNKFIIVVPSVAIRAGVMGTLADFGLQLAQSSGLNHPSPLLNTTAVACNNSKPLSTALSPPSW
jgi:type III restriction enzyme